MFGEGCYLHTAIVLTYSTDKLRKWMFICIGWSGLVCFIPSKEHISINFIFLFNIVRILMTKLRASTTSETIQYRCLVYVPFYHFVYCLFPSVDSSLSPQVRSAVRKRWHRWQDKHSIRARVARAMSIPTSPTRVSFHSIKQSSAV
uniref:Corticotropin releasing hormone receptor 1 n=1 Tax=Astyanax mexicanus TaxID=7994 RepID=A0A8B9J4Q3_ASTMX